MAALPLPPVYVIAESLSAIVKRYEHSGIDPKLVLALQWERGPPDRRVSSFLLIDLPPDNYAQQIGIRYGLRKYRGRTTDRIGYAVALYDFHPIRFSPPCNVAMGATTGESFIIETIPYRISNGSLEPTKG